MNKDTFISLIENPSNIDDVQFADLQNLVNQYPYFFTARKLYLKSLFDKNSTSYQPELKIAAVHAGNRAVLQSFINTKFSVKTQNSTEITEQQEVDEFIEIDFEKPRTNQVYTLPKVDIEEAKPLSEKKKLQFDIIDKFIKNEPKISIKDIKVEKEHDLTAHQDIETELLTETLANIYVKQKYYDKAIVMFQKLSLKFPQKSIYFANRISEINEIVNQIKK